MNKRILFVAGLLALVLMVCGTAVNSASASDLKTATQQPTATQVPATAMPESTPVTEASTPEPVQSLIINGTVVFASGAAVPQNLTVSLLQYDITANETVQTLTGTVQANGSYQFLNVPTGANMAYWSTVDYGDVTYNSDPIQHDGVNTTYDLPIVLYELTNDLSALTLEQVHVQFDLSTEEKVQVVEVYVLTNLGEKAVTVTSDGKSVPFIQLPAGITEAQYQLASGSAAVFPATGGFAILPGADLQYAIIASFEMPYKNSLKFSQSFVLPVTGVTVYTAEGPHVRSKQLTDGGTKAQSSGAIHLYTGSNLAAGSTLALTLSGKPGDKSFVWDNRASLIAGVAALGVALIITAVLLFLRDRRLQAEEEAEDGVDEVPQADALGDDREQIMDAIIALDDQFKTGDISKEAYEKRRDELKTRLKELS